MKKRRPSSASSTFTTDAVCMSDTSSPLALELGQHPIHPICVYCAAVCGKTAAVCTIPPRQRSREISVKWAFIFEELGDIMKFTGGGCPSRFACNGVGMGVGLGAKVWQAINKLNKKTRSVNLRPWRSDAPAAERPRRLLAARLGLR